MPRPKPAALANPERRRRALLVRMSAIGDIVHALPVAAALAREGWSVTWLSEPAGAPLLVGNPAVERVLVVPSPRAFHPLHAGRALAALRARRFDVALDVQGLWKSALWCRLARAERRIGHARGARRESSSAILLGETRMPPAEAVHVVDQNLALLTALGIQLPVAPDFPLPPLPALERDRDAEPEGRAPGRRIVLHPGGGWRSKLWPVARWSELARALAARGWEPLVTWGPDEESLATEVADGSGGAAAVARRTGLLEFAALARGAAALVAADTGPLHLASAAGARVVGLYGPTEPARNGPFAAASAVVRRRPPCAPCHRRRCARHAGVLAEIPAAEVLEALERVVAISPARPTRSWTP